MPSDLERSHDELRAALILAGRHIQRQRYSAKAIGVLKRLRVVYARRELCGDTILGLRKSQSRRQGSTLNALLPIGPGSYFLSETTS